jgi:uncharacterized membrane protein
MTRLIALLVLLVTACDPFPRDNPIDPLSPFFDAGSSDDGRVDSQVLAGPAVLVIETSRVADLQMDWPSNNGNGMAEPGESLRLDLTLRNSGGSDARGIQVSLSAPPGCATVRSSRGTSLEYGTIVRGGQVMNRSINGEYFIVDLSQTGCMAGTSVALTATARDESGRSWMIPVTLPIVESDARIEFASQRVMDLQMDSSRNNGNGMAEPGESLRLDLTLRNSGGSDARGIQVSLSAPPGCATVRSSRGTSLEYGTIVRGGQVMNRSINGEYFIVDLSQTGCMAGTSVALTATARDESGRSWMIPVTLPIVESDARIEFASQRVMDLQMDSSRNNGNGMAEPGESLRLDLTLRNSGGSDARGIQVSLSAPPGCATVRSSRGTSLEYGTIVRGGQVMNRSINGEYFIVDLSQTGCMAGTSVALTATARDESGRSWMIPVTLPIVESDARIEFASQRVMDLQMDSSRNNGNGMAEPGESLRLDLTLRNSGGSDARGIQVSLSAPPGCATVRSSRGTSLEYGTIVRGGQVMNRSINGEYFIVDLSQTGCMAGTSVALTATARDESGRSWMIPVTLPIVESDARIEFASQRVMDLQMDSSRNNGNGMAEPGESLRLDLTLRNSGGSDARGIQVSLSAPPGCATVRSSRGTSLEYGTIVRGGQVMNRSINGEYFIVDLSQTGCMAGTSVALTFRAIDASGRVWTGSSLLPVQ